MIADIRKEDMRGFCKIIRILIKNDAERADFYEHLIIANAIGTRKMTELIRSS